MTQWIFSFGRAFSLPDGKTFRGFLRPLPQTPAKASRRRTAPGIVEKADYMLVAPAGQFSESDEGTLIVSGDGEFKLLRVERKNIGGEDSHLECLLRLIGRIDNA